MQSIIGPICLGPLLYERKDTVSGSLVAQMVKHLPAMWETWVRFLGQEDPLEKEMAIHCSTLAWKIPWTEEPDRLQSMADTTERLHKQTESKGVNHVYCLSQSLCSLQTTFMCSTLDPLFLLPHLPPEKSVCRSRSNS